jgi:hypothetical protein
VISRIADASTGTSGRVHFKDQISSHQLTLSRFWLHDRDEPGKDLTHMEWEVLRHLSRTVKDNGDLLNTDGSQQYRWEILVVKVGDRRAILYT